MPRGKNRTAEQIIGKLREADFGPAGPLHLRQSRWFEVMETRGHIENGKIAHWQVRVKVGVTMDD